MKTLLLFLAYIVLSGLISGQNITGKITDSITQNPVEGVNIIIKGTQTGTTTDKFGNFAIQCRSFPCNLNITHVGYKTREIIIRQAVTGLTFQLMPETHNLETFRVYPEKIICINPKDKYFISDFRIIDGYILALAYKNRMKNQQYLVLFESDGTRITETEIIDNNGFYQDPDMNCYIRMLSRGWQIFHDSTGILFSEPFDVQLIDTAEKYLAAMKRDTLLLKEYFMSNQGIAFYYPEKETGKVSEFRTFVDEDKAGMLSWGPFFDGNEFDSRFAEEIFFKPIQVSIFILNETIVIFNNPEKKIEMISGLKGTTLRTTDMTFADKKGWTGKFMLDRKTGRFYTIFSIDGIYRVSEIDINSGNLKNETILEGYTHIENFTVWNGVIYFLYKKYYIDEYKRLYMSSLY